MIVRGLKWIVNPARAIIFIAASMGPEPESSGKLPFDYITSLQTKSFNGAGARKLRKTDSSL